MSAAPAARSARPGRQGRARRLHAAAPPYRHGDLGDALSQAALQAARGLRLYRPRHRSADGRSWRARTSSPTTSKRLIDYVKANKDKVTYANAGIGAASHLCGMLFMSKIEHQADDRALQGHRPGDDRSDRRPGRLHVRPDHQHHQPDQGRRDQGLCHDHHGAARRRCPTFRPPRRRASPDSKSAIWHGLYAPKGTPTDGRSTGSPHRCRRRLQDETVKSRFAELGTAPVTAGPGDAGGAQGQARKRDRALEAGDRGRRRIRRLSSRESGSAAASAGRCSPVVEGDACMPDQPTQGPAAGAIFVAASAPFS